MAVTMPHVHLSGANALVTVLYVIAILGAAKLLAMSFPDNIVSQSWLTLF